MDLKHAQLLLFGSHFFFRVFIFVFLVHHFLWPAKKNDNNKPNPTLCENFCEEILNAMEKFWNFD